MDNRIDYFKKIIAVLVPVTLQNLMGCAMGIVDTAMVGKLSVEALAASGAASMVAIVLFNLMYGFMSGTGAYISQYWGVKDMKNIKKTLGIVYIVSIAMGLLFTVAAELFAEKIIWCIDRNPMVIELGAQYMRVIAPSYAFAMLNYAIVFNSRCVQHMRTCTILDISAVVLNAVLDYVLIFGKFGAPAMAVKGAALATAISRVYELIVLLIYLKCSKNFPLKAKVSELLDLSADFCIRVIKTSIPNAVTDALWGVTLTVYLIAYGLIGTEALAAVQVVNIVCEWFQSIFYGVGSAASVIIGEQLGQGKIKRAEKSSVEFMFIGVVLSLSMGILMYIINPYIVGFYKFDEVTNAILRASLNVTAATIFFRMITFIIMCGILRAGGDTKSAMIIDIAHNWLITIPAMFVAILVFKCSLAQAMLVCYTGEFIKGISCYLRYRTGKWKNVLTGAEIND
ncbi:MAG: MATE family efflux transporter [Clostridia bacterium]|nr:MATE family efflux transporter [Clostridia bacterium]